MADAGADRHAGPATPGAAPCRNKAKLAQLGLVEASRALMSTAQGPGVTLEAGAEAQPRKKRRVAKEVGAPAGPPKLPHCGGS